MTRCVVNSAACKWVLQKGGCTAVFVLEDEKSPKGSPSLLGIGSFGKSITIEVFVSREEFQQEWREGSWLAPCRGRGRFRFVCSPPGIVLEEEVPQGWGLLYVGGDREVVCPKNPYVPKGGGFWRKGFDGEATFDLLEKLEGIYTGLKRLRYKGVVHPFDNR